MTEEAVQNERKCTIGQMVDEAAARNPQGDCVIYQGRQISYGEFNAEVNRFARGLLAIGIQKDDVLALWMTNRPEWLITAVAAARIGALLVPLSTRFKARELGAVLKGSDAKVLVMMDRFEAFDYLKILAEISPDLSPPQLPCLKHIICLTSQPLENGFYSFNEVLTIKSEEIVAQVLAEARAKCEPSDVSNIFFTSGTTGFPKGAMLTHHGVVQNADNVGRLLRLVRDDRLYLPVPLFSVYGWIDGALAAFNHGAAMVLEESYNPEKSLLTMEKAACTVVFGGDAMWIMWLQSRNLIKVDFSSVRTALVGGAEHRPRGHLNAIMHHFGLKWAHTLYGLSETSAAATMTRADDPLDFLYHSSGRAMPGVEVRIADPETGEMLRSGSSGEIIIKGFTVMTGYYHRPDDTAKVIDKNGWFHTGDLGEIDGKGNLKFKGRIKGEMFKSGGNNVYCREVEKFYYQNPKIKQVVLVGVPDPEKREVGMLFIELKKGENATEEEMIQFCKGKIAGYKIPRYVRFVTEFPMTSNLKIRKNKLREDVINETSTN